MAFLSDAILRIAPSATVAISRKAADMKRNGRDVISLAAGEPDFDTPLNVREAAIRAMAEGKTRYTNVDGIPELKAAVARKFKRDNNITATPEEIMVASGGKQIIFNALLATLNKGDEVVIPVPYWVSYPEIVRLADATPVFAVADASTGFKLSPEALEAAITPKTRLVILNTPHNPTGGILRADDLDAIAAILDRHPRIWIYADEIYSRLAYDGAFESIATRPGLLERTVISDGASKTWAMTGWRIGFAANRALAPVFTRWITNTDSCASQISQWAAVEAVNGPQDAAESMRARFRERRDFIVGLLNRVPGISCRSPGGAFYAWPNVTEACRMTGCEDSEVFRKRLLHEAGVAVLADIHFGRRVPGDGQHIRFSYAASNEAIAEGVRRVDAFVRAQAKR